MRIYIGLLLLLTLAATGGGAQNTAANPDSATFDPDGTAHITRVVPMPATPADPGDPPRNPEIQPEDGPSGPTWPSLDHQRFLILLPPCRAHRAGGSEPNSTTLSVIE